MATSLVINSVTLNCRDFREDVLLVASEWDDWEDSAYQKKIQTIGSIKKWSFRCNESATAWASSDYKAMRDAMEAGASVTCVFTFGGEELINENVVIIGVTKRYKTGYDAGKVRLYEVVVRAGDATGIAGDGGDGVGTDEDAIHDNVAGEIHIIVEKGSPVAADELVIEDSAASYAKKRVQIGNLPTGIDPDAIHDDVANEISAIAEKAVPLANADLLIIEDSEASYVKKKVQIGSLPSGGNGGGVSATGIMTIPAGDTESATWNHAQNTNNVVFAPLSEPIAFEWVEVVDTNNVIMHMASPHLGTAHTYRVSVF